MDVSEAPVEALAFSYLSFSFLMTVNSVWTWIALVTTAAVSVWRIRISSFPTPRMEENLIESWTLPSSLLALPVEQPEEKTSSKSDLVNCSLTTVVPPTVFKGEATIVGVHTRTSSRKFTVYYQEDKNYFEDDVADAVKCNDNAEIEMYPLENNWEAMMKLRTVNWLYSYQDLSVLDGSIVRLWEGCRRRKTAGLVTIGGGGVAT